MNLVGSPATTPPQKDGVAAFGAEAGVWLRRLCQCAWAGSTEQKSDLTAFFQRLAA